MAGLGGKCLSEPELRASPLMQIVNSHGWLLDCSAHWCCAMDETGTSKGRLQMSKADVLKQLFLPSLTNPALLAAEVHFI